MFASARGGDSGGATEELWRRRRRSEGDEAVHVGIVYEEVRENETNSPTMLKSSANRCKDQPNATDGVVLAELESQPLPKSNYCPTKMHMAGALLVGQANQASQAKHA